jgi:hypothetical protein
MPAASEPGWVAKLYECLGLAILVSGALFIWFVISNWLIVLLFVGLGSGAWWYFKSSWGQEWQLQEQQQALQARLDDFRAKGGLPDADSFVVDVLNKLRMSEPSPHGEIILELYNVTGMLYAAEFLSVGPPPVVANTIEGARWRDQAKAALNKLHDANGVLSARDAVLTAYQWFAETLPPAALQSPKEADQTIQAHVDDLVPKTTFSLSLQDAVSDLRLSVEHLILPFYKEEYRNYFGGLRATLDQNRKRAGGMVPTEYKGENPVYAYLQDTPLAQVFDARLPFTIPEHLRFEGQWVVAPPGRGKTTLLSAMFVEDMHKDATVIVMDSKGDLLDPIRRLKSLQDRLIILEPDANFPLALNPLDISKDTEGMDEGQKALRTNRALSTIEGLFSGLFEAKMSSLQSRFFRIVLRGLMTASESPTLATFQSICQGGFEKHIDLSKLRPEDRAFFEKEFNGKTYSETRQQVLWRLGLLLDNPVFRGMFLAKRTLVDMGELMDGRHIILINNSKAILDDEGAEFFGRFFLALIRSAAQQRSLLKDHEKVPVFFYIDECQSVISRDENISTIIDECRSQKIGLIMAHQRVTQIRSANVLDALSNCAIRFANSDEDARYLAPKLNTGPEFLRQSRGTFAAFIRDQTDTAISLKVPNPKVGGMDRMSQSEYDSVLRRMRSKYCTPVTGSPPEAPGPRLHHPDLPWKLEKADAADGDEMPSDPAKWPP